MDSAAKQNNLRRDRFAFTLIELLVVISIIGLLSTLAMIRYSQQRAETRDTRRLADIQSLDLALTLFYQKYHEYPRTNCLPSPPGCAYTWQLDFNNGPGVYVDQGRTWTDPTDDFLNILSNTFIQGTTPVDPRSGIRKMGIPYEYVYMTDLVGTICGPAFAGHSYLWIEQFEVADPNRPQGANLRSTDQGGQCATGYFNGVYSRGGYVIDLKPQ